MTSLKTTVFNSNANCIVSSIHGGELTGNTDYCRIERSLEDKFLNRQKYFDYPLPGSVLSTIAIAISSDGFLVATTHGDHTVKVFWYHDCQTHRVFRGHPRTPWTVKFHTTDSNILASGCLGFEVRVWDIKQNACVALSRYDYSIISLAFHPDGDIIGVATGPRLHMWRWKDHVYPLHVGRYATSNRKIADGRELRVLVHTRNIRAVLFHPDGDYVFTAAPDPPRQSQPAFTPCRLYAFTFDDIAVPSSWDTDEEEEGMDNGAVEETAANKYRWAESDSIQPQQQPQPQPPQPQQELSLCEFHYLIPQVHLYSDGGIDLSADGRYILTCARILVEPASHKPATAGDTSPSLFDGDNNETGAFCSSPQSPKEAHDTPLSSSSSSSSYLKKLSAHLQQNIHTRDGRGGLHFHEKLLSRSLWLESELEPELEFYDPNPRVRDSLTIRSSLKSPPPPPPPTSSGGRKYVFSDPRKENNELKDWTTEDHFCLIHLNLTTSSGRTIPYTIGSGYPGSQIQPSIARSFALNSSLVKAVTSTKLSPTGRYALIGYGVRSNSVVEGHPQQDVACEVINLLDMDTVTVMPDSEDEVNIAQFHPIPGMGILYGTKKGKVRTYRGCNAHDDINNDSKMEEDVISIG